MLFKQTVLDAEEFVTYKEENLELLELDFPFRKKNALPAEQKQHNDQLADKYNPSGNFPKVLLLSPDRKVLGEIAYTKGMTPGLFIAKLEALRTG